MKKSASTKVRLTGGNISVARKYVKKVFSKIMGDSVYFNDSEVYVEAYFTKNARNHFTGYASPEKAAMAEDFKRINDRAACAYSSRHDEHGENRGKTETELWDCFVGVVRVGDAELPVAFHVRHIKSDTRAQIYAIKEEANTYHGSGSDKNLKRHPNYAGISASEKSVPQNEEKSNRKIKTSAVVRLE